MSDNKYYTPEISELHVGFECEYREPHEKEWYEDSLNSNDVAYLLAYSDRIRVKYLDKEDIESFGFKYIDEDTYILPMLFKPIIFSPGKVWGDIIMHYHPEDNYTSITGFSEGQEEEYTLFMGLIKNKSELKKILQMTGVL